MEQPPGPARGKSSRAKEQPREQILGALARGTIEIQKTYLTISSVPRYFRRAPRGLPGRSDYLAFVVHAYLNEVYIMEQRMITYLKKLSRAAAKGSEARRGIDTIIPYLSKVMGDAFAGVRSTRGSHVHEATFSDDGIDRLGTFEVMTNVWGQLPTPKSL